MAYELRDFSDVAPQTTVASSITNSDTSVGVASGTGYPSGGASGNFMIQIENELIKCSSRTGNTITFAGGAAGRGQNGTAAASHITGTAVNFIHTAINDSKEANYAVNKTVGKVTTNQDLLVADAANSFTRLGIGANGTILQAVAGALGYGALPANSVGASQITDGTVGTNELGANVVTTAKIAASAVTTTEILDGTILNGDINAAAGIALSKLGTDPLARANHTGTQLAATVSNFDTQVRTSTLNQMAGPTADLAIGSHKLTGVTDPGSAQDAATKAYVDASVPLTTSTYTPTFKNGAGGGAYTVTVNYAHYVRIGPWVMCMGTAQVTAGGGNAALYMTLPVNHVTLTNDVLIGGFRLVDGSGTTRYSGSANAASADNSRCFYDVGDSTFLSPPTIGVSWFISWNCGYTVA